MKKQNNKAAVYFYLIIFFIFSQFGNSVLAQQKSRIDTSALKEVVVSAWANGRTRIQNGSAIAILKAIDFQKSYGLSLVPVFNQIPGLQMEERSPGSYRISIRGSSVRSPYGVRNIKVYLDQFSLTDAGGNTYLNALEMQTIGSAEVIKGPSGSAYGAGTGGVILFKTAHLDSGNHIFLKTQVGSFGLKNISLEAGKLSNRSSYNLFLSDFKTDGYRTNTALERQVIHYHSENQLDKNNRLGITGFYSNLAYQTPGGLTLAEYNKDPRQARPATKTTPSVVSQHAAIYEKQLFLGVSDRFQLNEYWFNESSVSLNHVQFKNPFITNYQRKEEQNYSLKSVFHFKHKVFGQNLHAQFGVEYMDYYAPDRDYTNKGGIPDSITRDDQITNRQLTGFIQAEIELPWSLIATAALSSSKVHYQVFRFSQKIPGLIDRPFSPAISPRISLLKNIDSRLSIYSSLSFGYSPPSNLETLSATGVFNSNLQPEKAHTWEVGMKGSNVAEKYLDFDISAFINHVSQTIVRRTNIKGQEYFINEGNTLEKGIEVSTWIYFLRSGTGLISQFSFRGSAAINQFEFGDQGSGSTVLKGRPLTGTPPYTTDAGLEINSNYRLGLLLNMHYSDRIPLSDAGNEKSQAFTIFSSRIDFTPIIGKIKLNAFVGADNIFNIKYSLGNDLNAFGGRYYNAAPTRNFFIGLKVGY